MQNNQQNTIIEMQDSSNYNYTLEKHLKNLCDNDKEYELLYSIWDLNKKNLTQGLNVVSTNYPNYSLHDASHSYSIIDNIQSVLGADRIKRLGATDTFLLLMASLTHDIGMILTYKLIENEWGKASFKNTLNDFASIDDTIISDAAKLLLSYQKNDNHNIADSFTWALEIKNAVTIITAEIFRSRHAKLSADYITKDTEFKKIAENFHSEQLPNRFMDLLAKVAFLHGQEFDEVMSKLYYKADGFKGDYIHPRFISCMLRLGDLLDFDSNRFNLYANATLKEMPDISNAHKLKHAAVKHKLVSPSAIEAELDCPNEKVYRVARSWFDWLETEVNNQSREWSIISPDSLGGLPPVISKDSIKILFNGIDATPELLNLKFTMSQKKMFEIIQGGGIYKEPGFAFIREIVQNAFDASKIQMWKDIKAGFYDSYFTEQNKSIDDIEFPDDIPSAIYNQYPVKLSVKWKDEEKTVLHFECEDHGTGISEATLIRMTQHVGESHHQDSDYCDLYKSMRYWLKPTAAFGIGLQSIFFVASTFEVETSYIGETTKRIVFRSAADNQYSSIVEQNISRKRGTTIKVDISKERFAELFGTTFNWGILNSVDIYQGEGDDIYLAKIDAFVLNTFNGIEWLIFNYEPENSERRFVTSTNFNNTSFVSDGDYKYTSFVDNGYLVFYIHEKKFGSTLKLWFSNEFRNYDLHQRLLLRDVLVSNAKFNYYRISHLGFEWNLNNQESDTIVDLSRDNLTYNGCEWVHDTLLNVILPKVLSLIEKKFLSVLEQGENAVEYKDFGVQCLNYVLSAYAFNIDLDASLLNNLMLPQSLVSCDNSAINAKQFVDSPSLLLIQGLKLNGFYVVIPEEQNRIIQQFGKTLLSGKTTLWVHDFFYAALLYNYHCKRIIKWDKNCSIIELNKFNPSENKFTPSIVDCDVKTNYLLGLEKIDFYNCTRNTIYGLAKYKELIVKRNYITGFEDFPEFCNCYIYSPFSNKKQVDTLIASTNNLDDELEICNLIRSHISEYISPSLMRILIKDNIDEHITEERIKDGYVSLIYDFIMAKKAVINAQEGTV